jgi:superoxide dismutase
MNTTDKSMHIFSLAHIIANKYQNSPIGSSARMKLTTNQFIFHIFAKNQLIPESASKTPKRAFCQKYNIDFQSIEIGKTSKNDFSEGIHSLNPQTNYFAK